MRSAFIWWCKLRWFEVKFKYGEPAAILMLWALALIITLLLLNL